MRPNSAAALGLSGCLSGCLVRASFLNACRATSFVFRKLLKKEGSWMTTWMIVHEETARKSPGSTFLISASVLSWPFSKAKTLYGFSVS